MVMKNRKSSKTAFKKEDKKYFKFRT